jgi:hypothetical protein
LHDVNTDRLTKTDYLLYREAPLHLWAKAHGRIPEAPPAPGTLHRMRQGLAVEGPARDFLEARLGSAAALSWQPTLADGPYEFRADALACQPAGGPVELYEVKAVTHLDDGHLEEMAYETVILRALHPLGQACLVRLNRKYVLGENLDPGALFAIQDVTALAAALESEVREERRRALALLAQDAPPLKEGCGDPRSCPCPELCHPGLPELSIYELPRLGAVKAAQLRADGILDLRDVPDEFPLNERQRRTVEAARRGAPIIARDAIRSMLAELAWPLWFLDYETFDPSVPRFRGYRPYEPIVFQFSLHRLASPDAEPEHFEHLALGPDDPSQSVVEALAQTLGPGGSVLVWNKSFEATRNRELAVLHPKHAAQLMDINERLFDLMTVFSRGHYVHPGFHGSASIKAVLPALLPQFSYAGLAVADGSQAMLTWEDLFQGRLYGEARESAIQNLLDYCRLDTLAMVEIWRLLNQMA